MFAEPSRPTVMKLLADEIVRRCAAGERVALCLIVATKGSTPQERGAKMLVLADGRTLGTLGGGCVEAEVKQTALALLQSGQSQAMRFSLDHDYGWDDGLICGGVMDVFMDVIEAARVKEFEEIAAASREDRSATIDFRYTIEGKPARYVEELGPAPVLLVVGAGHVGQALAKLAGGLDFQVDVIDDRADQTTTERFPTARRLLVGDIEAQLSQYVIRADTYVVIVTRGHKNDGRALASVVNSAAKYIGLIGSKRKIKTILEDLHEAGVEQSKLMRVHAPIGLEIGAVTVPEIAVSIAAELIAVRRGRENVPAGPMKIDPSALKQWLERKS